MEFLRNLVQRINANPITRNIVLAACALIVFVFITNILLNLFTRHGQVHEVPDFSGMTVEEAIREGRHSSLKIEVSDSIFVPTYAGGVILEQNPYVGAKVKSGRRIFVTINAFQQKTVVIPYVAGYSLRQAKNNLEVAGLQIDRLIYQPDIATNNVLEQRYKGKAIHAGNKAEAEVGAGITLIVGIGEGESARSVPRVVGYTLREAKSRLWEAGFNVGKISRDDDVTLLNEKDAKVYMQSPVVGSYASLGQDINLDITLDQDKTTKGLKSADKQARAAAKALADSLANSQNE